MGTINYKTSDYITLGMRPYDVDDFINDDDFIEQYAEWGGRGTSTAEEFAYQVIGVYENDDYENIKSILGKDGHRGFFHEAAPQKEGVVWHLVIWHSNSVCCWFSSASWSMSVSTAGSIPPT